WLPYGGPQETVGPGPDAFEIHCPIRIRLRAPGPAWPVRPESPPEPSRPELATPWQGAAKMSYLHAVDYVADTPASRHASTGAPEPSAQWPPVSSRLVYRHVRAPVCYTHPHPPAPAIPKP